MTRPPLDAASPKSQLWPPFHAQRTTLPLEQSLMHQNCFWPSNLVGHRPGLPSQPYAFIHPPEYLPPWKISSTGV